MIDWQQIFAVSDDRRMTDCEGPPKEKPHHGLGRGGGFLAPLLTGEVEGPPRQRLSAAPRSSSGACE
jgi:hypothetical protein